MQIVNLNYLVTIVLGEEDCAALARFLKAAEQSGAFDKAGQESDQMHCSALASTFTALAVISAAQGWIRPADHDHLVEDLAAMGLDGLLSRRGPVLTVQDMCVEKEKRDKPLVLRPKDEGCSSEQNDGAAAVPQEIRRRFAITMEGGFTEMAITPELYEQIEAVLASAGR